MKNKTILNKSNLINLKSFCIARETLKKKTILKWGEMVMIKFKNNLFISKHANSSFSSVSKNKLNRKTGQRSK